MSADKPTGIFKRCQLSQAGWLVWRLPAAVLCIILQATTETGVRSPLCLVHDRLRDLILVGGSFLTPEPLSLGPAWILGRISSEDRTGGKMSHIHYKYKSCKDYDIITFDGLHISLADLKKAIIQRKKLIKSTDFDLEITNAQTQEGKRSQCFVAGTFPSNISATWQPTEAWISPWKPRKVTFLGLACCNTVGFRFLWIIDCFECLPFAAYKRESDLIPKNSSVLVSRVPIHGTAAKW